MTKNIVLLAALLALASPAAAQDHQDRRTAELKAALERGMVSARVPLETITTGAPFSAQSVTETSQTLGDGNRINRKVTGRIYRDGSGRVRREEDRQDGTVAVSIVDPIAGVSYRLDPETRVAWKTPTNTVVSLLKRAADQEQAERAVTETLAKEAMARSGGAGEPAIARGRLLERIPAGPPEHRTIEGIPVEGRAASKTIPAGEIGNERPITIVNEQWSSPDLKVLVMTHHSDPRTGDSTYQLTNIIRAEPDATLFTVPPGYEIRESGVRREQK